MINLRGFKYSPQTGMIYRTQANPNQQRTIGPVSRKPMKDGYLQCSVNGKNYRQHQIAMAFLGYTTTRKMVTDHINGIRHDNRACNLRLVPQLTNTHNQAKHRKGATPGVFYHKFHKKWVARLYKEGKRVYLGYYTSETEAIKALQNQVQHGHVIGIL